MLSGALQAAELPASAVPRWKCVLEGCSPWPATTVLILHKSSRHVRAHRWDIPSPKHLSKGVSGLENTDKFALILAIASRAYAKCSPKHAYTHVRLIGPCLMFHTHNFSDPHAHEGRTRMSMVAEQLWLVNEQCVQDRQPCLLETSATSFQKRLPHTRMCRSARVAPGRDCCGMPQSWVPDQNVRASKEASAGQLPACRTGSQSSASAC